MNGWQRWWQAPHSHWLRRAVFQLHLWLGIGLGLYLLVLSVSGSAIVLRPQLHRWLRGSPDATEPWLLTAVEWLTLLHDELLLGRTGQMLNGIGGVLLLLMAGSGLLLWWPGRRRWRAALLPSAHSGRPLLWHLHALAGVWTFVLLFAWGFTAVYFAWPRPFDLVIDGFDPDLQDAARPDGWLLTLIDLHFGRFRGRLWAALLWVLLGLAPAFLVLSGCLLWYRRVLRRGAGGRAGQHKGRMP